MKKIFTLSAAIVAASVTAPVKALELDSIIVSAQNTINRYAYSGELLETVEIPAITSGATARDIIAISETKIAVFNGVFTPTLSVFDGSVWQNAEYEGWSIANNISFGGIAATEDYIFVGDMSTGSGGAAQGIVRFTADLAAAERFLPAYEFIDLTIGEDGLLYGLTNTYGDLLIIDPEDMSVVSSLDLGHTSGSRAVVADADGNIYMAAWNGVISKFNSTGQLLEAVDTGSALGDLDIQQGKLLASSVYDSTALLYSTEFDFITSFTAPGRYPFATFSYQEALAEPVPVVTASVNINSDWGSGYCANLVLTNTSAEPQTWSVELEVDGDISNLWGGSWSQTGNTLSVTGLSWNATLQPGQSNTSVGFCASR
ncbi:cellulose binding domain-containing protein [Gilvimarinus sp. DA14]|uniref:cellulose binding domain-containing protein n=1 Tax=Gilvimarinus sp. DA14 TaxID=2956798 RepID=UPI0020B78191|nr:cellulose binding domain-containing protein [Gilvimarinus sp. DA14]UTF59006.1 cellulose binding domain-containing protein [Gilvimarinus sp. DA14]